VLSVNAEDVQRHKIELGGKPQEGDKIGEDLYV
jgi:hypothetical protein